MPAILLTLALAIAPNLLNPHTAGVDVVRRAVSLLLPQRLAGGATPLPMP